MSATTKGPDTTDVSLDELGPVDYLVVEFPAPERRQHVPQDLAQSRHLPSHLGCLVRTKFTIWSNLHQPVARASRPCEASLTRVGMAGTDMPRLACE